MTQWGLDTLFNPAKRHMDEEKRRLQSTREEIGDSSGGKRIDLESGKVTIQRSAKDDDADADELPAEEPVAAEETEQADEPRAETATDRARARRARQRAAERDNT
jgi:hypothetical protein